MAENKKSFVLYADLIKSIEHLTNEEKGILFNHLLLYVNDKNPILEDRLILTAWKPIELQLKRDLVKFEEVKAKRSDAGKRSAELRALKSEEQNSTNLTSVESVKQSSTNSTVNDTVTVNDNDTVTVNETIKEKRVVNKFTAPAELEVITYFIENGYNEITAKKAFKYYETGEWKDSSGKQVRNWKQKMQSVWFKEENKIPQKSNGFDYNTVRGKLS